MSDLPPCRRRSWFEMSDDPQIDEDAPLLTQSEHISPSRGLSGRHKVGRTMTKRRHLLRAKSERFGGSRRCTRSDMSSLQGSITIPDQKRRFVDSKKWTFWWLSSLN